MPVPFTTVGRRTVSNVPAQSLILMNDPFVLAEAARWAKRVLSQPGSVEERIERMYQAAFGRPATARELADSVAFLQAQVEAYAPSRGKDLDQEQAWTDLAHVLFNVKEFIFIQ